MATPANPTLPTTGGATAPAGAVNGTTNGVTNGNSVTGATNLKKPSFIRRVINKIKAKGIKVKAKMLELHASKERQRIVPGPTFQ